MKLAVDLRLRGWSGIGRYVDNLVSVLAHRPELELLLLNGPDQAGETGDCSRSLVPRSAPFSVRELWEIGRLVHGANASLLHVPHFNTPILHNMPLVVTIHDVAYLDHPEWLRNPAARAYYRIRLELAVRSAREIITVSHHARERIAYHLPVNPEQVSVIPLAPDRHLSSGQSGQGLGPPFTGSDPYFLYVGNVRPNKNVMAVIAGFERLQRRLGGARIHLVIVGQMQQGYRAVAEAVENSAYRQCIHLVGSLADGLLAGLYRGATAFVFPSLYEGFGLPPLEAMAAGCPVICSTAASLPEVVHNAALMFRPDDVEALSAHMESVLSNTALRENLRRLGLARAAEFSWERTAAATFEIYRRALQE